MAEQQQHPVTPPPELIREWNEEAATAPMADQRYIAIQAARWGFRQCTKVDAAWLEDKLQKARDQELEACCEWCADGSMVLAQELRDARRPKPPSLAKQGCDALDTYIYGNPNHKDKERTYNTIRSALERLQELESDG